MHKICHYIDLNIANMQNMHSICINMHKICINMQTICRQYADICIKYAQIYHYIDFNIAHKQIICIKYASNMLNMQQKYAKNMQTIGRRFAAALLPRLFGTNPRSHHKGATGRVLNGDQRLPVLCHCQLGQDICRICITSSIRLCIICTPHFADGAALRRGPAGGGWWHWH